MIWPKFLSGFLFAETLSHPDPASSHHFFRKNSVKLTHLILNCTVWKNTKKSDHDFCGNINIFSVKSTSLLKISLWSWFHGKFWAWSHFIVLFHTVNCIVFCFHDFFFFVWNISWLCTTLLMTDSQSVHTFNFVKVTVLLKKLLRVDLTKYFSFFHTVVWK